MQRASVGGGPSPVVPGSQHFYVFTNPEVPHHSFFILLVHYGFSHPSPFPPSWNTLLPSVIPHTRGCLPTSLAVYSLLPLMELFFLPNL